MKRRCERCVFAEVVYGDGNVLCRLFGLVSHEDAERCGYFIDASKQKELEDWIRDMC